MIDITKTEVFGFEAAIRGMRNPLNSWEKSDSYWTHVEDSETNVTANYGYFVGEKDFELGKKLILSGPDHAKFLRDIVVTMDISAPFYWWKEFDTYKIGTTANSCSTMHTIHKTGICPELFSTDHLNTESKTVLGYLCDYLERCRTRYNETKDKDDWYQIIELLPSAFNQLRTIQLNYSVLRNQYFARRNHKLAEWHGYCDWIESLPYSEWITLADPRMEKLEELETMKEINKLFEDGVITRSEARRKLGLNPLENT